MSFIRFFLHVITGVLSMTNHRTFVFFGGVSSLISI